MQLKMFLEMKFKLNILNTYDQIIPKAAITLFLIMLLRLAY